MDKEKIKIISISTSLFILAVFLIFFFGIIPLWKSIKAEESNLKKVEFKIKSLEEKRKNIAEYRKREQDLEMNGELIKGAVLKKGEEVFFVEELEKAAEKAGVQMEIKGYTPPAKKSAEGNEGEKIKQETIEEMKKRQEAEKDIEHFQLILKGGYPQVLNFVYKLENMGRSFQVSSIKLANLFETKGEIESALRQKQTPDKFALKGEVIISFTWQ